MKIGQAAMERRGHRLSSTEAQPGHQVLTSRDTKRRVSPITWPAFSGPSGRLLLCPLVVLKPSTRAPAFQVARTLGGPYSSQAAKVSSIQYGKDWVSEEQPTVCGTGVCGNQRRQNRYSISVSPLPADEVGGSRKCVGVRIASVAL